MIDPEDVDDDLNDSSDSGAASETDDATVNLDPSVDDDDVKENEDGSATIVMDDNAPGLVNGFFENLAETMTQSELHNIGSNLIDMIAEDKEARKARDKQYEDGLKRTGLGDEAPGGASFEGASRVVHPILTETCVDFSSRVMKELFPADGPVKASIVGTPSAAKDARAKRKTKFMNYQLTKLMPEFRSELEQMLTQVPLGGAQYIKMYYNARLKRPMAEFVSIDNIIIPYAASSFRAAERKTHVQTLTEMEFQRRVKSGHYRDISIVAAGDPEQSSSGRANDKIEGRVLDSSNQDGVRTVYEIGCYLDLKDDDNLEPYLVTIDGESGLVCAIYRNWDEKDENKEEIQHIVEFPFVPWRGAYPIGLPHMIGGIAAAATGALRALLDSAHINNFASAVKLKGGASSQTIDMQPASISEIEGSFQQDDIRKVIMPLPFNPPSAVLYQLLGFLVDSGKGVVQTTFESLADQSSQMPVGTTLALIEQGMTVFSAIHARLHNAMAQLLDILHRLNFLYMKESEVDKLTGEVMVKRRDFEGAQDVIPVSDPNIFSETQRFAQVQAIVARSDANPGLYDKRKIEELILTRLKIPNGMDLLAPIQQPQHMNAVNENMAATMSRPIVAFPQQDHEAHIRTHVEYMQHPLFGQNPIIKQTLTPIMMGHLKEHLAFWYVTQVFNFSSEAAGSDISKLMDNEDETVTREFDGVMMQASAQILQSVGQNKVLSVLPPVIQQAMQYIQSIQQPPPIDPSQVASQKIQMDAQSQQQKLQFDQQALQAKMQLEQSKVQASQANSQTDAQSDMQDAQIAAQSRMSLEQMREQAESQRKMAELQTRIQTNTADNHTAMLIAGADIANGHRSNLKDGTGINPQ